MALADSDGDVLHYYHLVPIGGMIPFNKNMTGVPTLGEGWIECDGSTINDSESPMNGQTVPDLNGTTDADSRFLRGATTSGGTGGSYQHNHGAGTPYNYDAAADIGLAAANHIPPYYEVVWIIRIK